MQLTLTGHVTPEDKAQSDYLYAPFDLPQPARRLEVRYHYTARMSHDRVEGGNVIDIGIFDPRGSDFPGGAGFRGWSGSDRQTFTITATEATPGYIPGPLPAGRYQIILGLYRIWPQGADFKIEIEADGWGYDETAVSKAAPTFSPATGAGHKTAGSVASSFLWLRGDLQSHTFHSDGKGSPSQLVTKARALGLDFLAVTDHNTISHHPPLIELADDDLLLIRGQEVTSYYGHMNVWGTGRWCDFRSRSEEAMAAIIALAHESGGLCSINHPKKGGPPWEYGPNLPVDAIEVWQGPWPNRNNESLALWEELLRDGRRLPAVGGSDYHCPSGDQETGFLRLGQPTTWVKVSERSPAGVLNGIRAGRTCISASPEGPMLDLRATGDDITAEMGQALSLPAGRPAHVAVEVTGGAGLTLRLLTEAGIVDETKLDSDRATVNVETTARRYIRAELVGDMPPEQLPDDAPAGLDRHNWRWALSNPIYIQPIST